MVDAPKEAMSSNQENASRISYIVYKEMVAQDAGKMTVVVYEVIIAACIPDYWSDIRPWQPSWRYWDSAMASVAHLGKGGLGN